MFNFIVILLLGISITTLTGCQEPLESGFESQQAVCSSPGDCHVTRMPSDNDLGYTVRPQQ